MEVRALDRTRREREDRIGRELSSEFSGAQILRRAVIGAVENVEGCDYAGVSLRSHTGEVQTPAWTSPTVWVADAMQATIGDGPSLEPMWVADYVTVDDLSTNQRWAQWAPSVVTLGLRSLISVRLPGGSQTFAALNLYSARAYGFGLTSLDEACSYARWRFWTPSRLLAGGRLRDGDGHPELVSMAQGVMRYRYGFEVSRALSLLQTYSVRSHVKLQDAAKEFVEGEVPGRLSGLGCHREEYRNAPSPGCDR